MNFPSKILFYSLSPENQIKLKMLVWIDVRHTEKGFGASPTPLSQFHTALKSEDAGRGPARMK